MIRVPPKDASILARVAQYTSMPLAEREAILRRVSTDEARQIGEVLLGTRTTPVLPEIQQAADALKLWVDTNRKIGPERNARPSAGSVAR